MLCRQLEEARSLLRRFESQVRQQQQDLDYKNQELETVRKELAELWTTHNQLTEHSSQQADLIRQVQSLQTDTQKSNFLYSCCFLNLYWCAVCISALVEVSWWRNLDMYERPRKQCPVRPSGHTHCTCLYHRLNLGHSSGRPCCTN